MSRMQEMLAAADRAIDRKALGRLEADMNKRDEKALREAMAILEAAAAERERVLGLLVEAARYVVSEQPGTKDAAAWHETRMRALREAISQAEGLVPMQKAIQVGSEADKLRACLRKMHEYFSESHATERDAEHYGDDSCSYCEVLNEAAELLGLPKGSKDDPREPSGDGVVECPGCKNWSIDCVCEDRGGPADMAAWNPDDEDGEDMGAEKKAYRVIGFQNVTTCDRVYFTVVASSPEQAKRIVESGELNGMEDDSKVGDVVEAGDITVELSDVTLIGGGA